MGLGTSFGNAESHVSRKPPTSMRSRCNQPPSAAAATRSRGGFRVTWDNVFIGVGVVITVAW
jgi:hypothetical protein